MLRLTINWEIFSSFFYRQFLQPADIPEETQYFSWAPEGNKLVSSDTSMIAVMCITLTDSSALKVVMEEASDRSLTLEHSMKGSNGFVVK